MYQVQAPQINGHFKPTSSKVTKTKERQTVTVVAPQSTWLWPLSLCCEKPTVLIETSEDYVDGTVRADSHLAPNQAGIVLNVASDITWWKGIEIVSAPDIASVLNTKRDAEDTGCTVLGGVYTRWDFTGPSASAFTLPKPSANSSLFLRFRKAGLFGVHTTMYAMPLSLAAGASLYITWKRDE